MKAIIAATVFAFYSTEAHNEVQSQHHWLRKLTKAAQIDRRCGLQLKIIIGTEKWQLIARFRGTGASLWRVKAIKEHF